MIPREDGQLAYLTPIDLGTPGVDPVLAGFTWNPTNTVIDMTAGGTDLWGTVDVGHLAYRLVTGNFDLKVRVQSLSGPNTWTKAGLMVRTSTNANSRDIYFVVTPDLANVPAGQNRYAFQWRDTDGASAAWGSEAVIEPPYPNAWLRLQRLGSVINAYWSTNGVDWLFYASRNTALYGGAYPDTVVVGLVLTSHDNSAAAKLGRAEFRNLYIPLPAAA